MIVRGAAVRCGVRLGAGADRTRTSWDAHGHGTGKGRTANLKADDACGCLRRCFPASCFASRSAPSKVRRRVSAARRAAHVMRRVALRRVAHVRRSQGAVLRARSAGAARPIEPPAPRRALASEPESDDGESDRDAAARSRHRSSARHGRCATNNSGDKMIIIMRPRWEQRRSGACSGRCHGQTGTGLDPRLLRILARLLLRYAAHRCARARPVIFGGLVPRQG
jgi:hypothetical protein